MGQRYKPEELVKLRQSPLVHKPASLPPPEEWMGPPPPEPQTQQQNRRHNENRNKNESSVANDGHSKPSLLEMRLSTRGSSNVPADIVLGPPKTAFASTGSLKSPRGFDSPARTAFGNFGGDSARTDYFGRSKFNGEKDGQKDVTRQQRDGESWGGRKNQDSGQVESGEELEPRGQRRNTRQNDWNADGKRNGNGRDNKPAWAKDDDTPTAKISKEEKDANINSIRSRAWRDGDKSQRKMQEFSERNPEWMADESEPKKEKHTAQDIEEWKAQMKAQSKVGKEGVPSEDTGHARTNSGTIRKSEKPLIFDKGLDSFFEQFGKPQQLVQESAQTPEDATPAQPSKGFAKSSRFTGFFGPATPTAPAPPQQPVAPLQAPFNGPTAQESALRTYNNLFNEDANGNDDKAGFDRVLSMLRSSAPVVDVGVPKLPPNATQAENKQAPQSPTIHSPRSQKKHGLESILGQHSQPEPPRGVINKDTEFLLNLLRKDDGVQSHFPGLGQPGPVPAPPPGLPRTSDEHFFDDRRHHERHGIDKLNPTANQSRPPTQSRLFDHPHEQHPHHPPFNDLPGPLRPSNFEPLPGFPPMAGRGGMIPPPGFPGRNMNQPFPPGLGPAMGNLNLGGLDRPPPFMHHGPPPPPPGFNGPLQPPFPPGIPMMGPGQFPLQGRPPMMDMFGPGPGSGPGLVEHGKNGVNGHPLPPPHPQGPPGPPPPGFLPRD